MFIFTNSLIQRWLTNHKDIGTFYSSFVAFWGITVTFFSILIKLELSQPGDPLLNRNFQYYNFVVTAHAFIINFFMIMLTLIGGLRSVVLANYMSAVFSIFVGFYYWFEKMVGFPLNKTLGKIHFWVAFFGINLTFFSMHFLGMTGMPRRIPDYALHFFGWNHLAFIGSYSFFTGIVLFLYILAIDLVSRFTSVQTPNLKINEG